MDANLPPRTAPPGAAERDANPVADLARLFAAERGVDLSSTRPDEHDLGATWSAMAAHGIEHPGLAFGSWATTTLLGGAFPTILANSPTVGSLLERLQRFHPIFGGEQVALTHERRGAWLSLRAAGGGPADPDTVDAFFAMVCSLVARLTADAATPTRISLRRPPPAATAPYVSAFGDVVRFGAEDDRSLFDADSLDLAVERADPAILAALEPYAERRINEQGRAWAAVVARLAASHLDEPYTLASASRALVVSPRTLQARLAEEGTTFSAILDGVQRERALSLLATSNLPVTTIASSIGFASPAALSRAVRRWTGVTPSDYRRRRQASANS